MHTAISSAVSEFEKSLSHLAQEFAGLQTGRASAGLVESIQVEVYGSNQPLKNIAQIATPDARTIQITPFDKNVIGTLEKAIQESDIGLNPNNNGNSILLNIPPMTEERRKDVVKVVHKKSEEAKISIRNARHHALDQIKKEELSEDETKRAEKELQQKVDQYNGKIEESAKKKEHEVMTV